jgi:peptide-methionine (S)-S-oxide reductase
METEKNVETIVLGGGCFWCIEATFSKTIGVVSAISGYAGGKRPNPSYEMICTGITGHAEVVQITFDTAQITLDDILHIFFTIHDPTTLNKQGHDVGTQYRSVIFYLNEEQKKVAEKIMQEIDEQGVWGKPLVTELLPLPEFYPAEDYHQHYFEKNPDQAYCQIVIAPKLTKFREKYRKFYK